MDEPKVIEIIRLAKTKSCADFLHKAAMKWDNVALLEAINALAFFAADYDAREMIVLLAGLQIERDLFGNVDRNSKLFRERLLLKGGEILGQIMEKEEAEMAEAERRLEGQNIRIVNF